MTAATPKTDVWCDCHISEREQLFTQREEDGNSMAPVSPTTIVRHHPHTLDALPRVWARLPCRACSNRVSNSYEALAAMHHKSQEDRENNEAAGIIPAEGGGSPGGTSGGGGAAASASAVARSRRLRPKNEPCALPDRLLHRVSEGTKIRRMASFIELYF